MREHLHPIALELLQQLISIQSFSREEDKTANLLMGFFKFHGMEAHQKGNNVWAINKHYDPSKPTILFNSHHDTVKPNAGYTRDPFTPSQEDGKLYGLGSNDAGGPLVSLIGAFIRSYEKKDLKYNLVLAATAEEEISGVNGIENIWSALPTIDCALIGEPTQMKAAIAERGLMVIDCVAKGKAGHAAREEGVNAIYESLTDINWFKSFQFPLVSPTLGPVKMSVTIINAGQAHNQVPDACTFTVDVRATNSYSLEEILSEIKKNVKSTVTPRSLRLRPSSTPLSHALVTVAKKMNIELFGSPTTSDWSLMPVPGLKIGPGDSARSHSADEFIYLDEIEKGIEVYCKIIDSLEPN